MIKPSDEVIRAFAHIAQNVPVVKAFLDEQYHTELYRLPVTNGTTGIAQGRCQVWGEIYNLLKDSPEFVADVRKSKLL
jgi:hypothetical protein|tara:strand:- start:4733 stop:4966 length:234 start_codon:yes stop_codon:yes gene_type:complete